MTAMAVAASKGATLASGQRAGYVTGSTIRIDGGPSAGVRAIPYEETA